MLRTRILVAVAMTAAAWTLASRWPESLPREFWFWLLACLAGELMWVPLPMGRGSTASMASCFNYAALLVLRPGEALLATVIATAIGERFGLKKPMLRVAYNTSHTALAVATGAWVFDTMAGGNRDLVSLLSHLQLAPILLSALAFYSINRTAVVLAIASCEGVPVGAAWSRNFGSTYEALSSGAIFSLGALFATHFQGIGMAGTVLVALPLLLACDGLRRFNERAARENAATRPEDDRKAA
jgi:hypothetical protein